MAKKYISRSWIFVHNELRADFRQLQSLAAQTMFVVVSTYLIYSGLDLLGQTVLSNRVFNLIFWLIMIFTVVNVTASSFIRDAKGMDLYYYTLINPSVYFAGKLLSSFLSVLLLSFLLTLLFSQVFSLNYMLSVHWWTTTLLGALGMTGLFTLIAGMASRTGQNQILIVVLGFPLAIPLLLFLMKNLWSIDMAYSQDFSIMSLSTLLVFDGLILGLGFLLFPYIWGD